jgi:hypothetical protein
VASTTRCGTSPASNLPASTTGRLFDAIATRSRRRDGRARDFSATRLDRIGVSPRAVSDSFPILTHPIRSIHQAALLSSPFLLFANALSPITPSRALLMQGISETQAAALTALPKDSPAPTSFASPVGTRR